MLSCVLALAQVRVTPMTEGGRLTNVIWVHRDVTEIAEKQNMLALRSRVLNFLSDGIFIADCAGRLMHTNQGFARLTGYEQLEALGRPWTFLLVRCAANTLSVAITQSVGDNTRQRMMSPSLERHI